MRTFAVTSGKGGVGKTNVSANLSIAFAAKHQRVVTFDADIGLANLDVVLGTKSQYKLQHVLAREKTLQEVLEPGPGGIRYVAGGSGIESLVRMDGPDGEQFLMDLEQLENETDILLFDTGAGIDENVMTFLAAADEVLLVTTPDPASMTDAYATAKALLSRKPMASIKVIMNMVEDEAQARAIFAKLTSISQQFLGRPLSYGGSIRLDPKATVHIRQRRPFILADPDLAASKDVKAIAASLLGEVHVAAEMSLASRFRSLLGSWRLAKSA